MLALYERKVELLLKMQTKEPEIIDVATLLTSMGARIKGAGTDVIRIDGVDSYMVVTILSSQIVLKLVRI